MKHDVRAFNDLLKRAAEALFTIQQKNNKCVIYAPNGKDFYIAHPGEQGVHPLRRFLKKHGVN